MDGIKSEPKEEVKLEDIGVQNDPRRSPRLKAKYERVIRSRKASRDLKTHPNPTRSSSRIAMMGRKKRSGGKERLLVQTPDVSKLMAKSKLLRYISTPAYPDHSVFIPVLNT